MQMARTKDLVFVLHLIRSKRGKAKNTGYTQAMTPKSLPLRAFIRGVEVALVVPTRAVTRAWPGVRSM
jgi:hypothetical protein